MCVCIFCFLYVFCVVFLCSFLLQYFDTVGWVFWPVKTVSHITYTVLEGTQNTAQSNPKLPVASSSLPCTAMSFWFYDQLDLNVAFRKPPIYRDDLWSPIRQAKLFLCIVPAYFIVRQNFSDVGWLTYEDETSFICMYQIWLHVTGFTHCLDLFVLRFICNVCNLLYSTPCTIKRNWYVIRPKLLKC